MHLVAGVVANAYAWTKLHRIEERDLDAIMSTVRSVLKADVGHPPTAAVVGADADLQPGLVAGGVGMKSNLPSNTLLSPVLASRVSTDGEYVWYPNSPVTSVHAFDRRRDWVPNPAAGRPA